nr:hypothetical protein [Streptomyces sp. SID9913]
MSPRRPGADPRPHRAAARGGGAVRPAVGAHVVDTVTGRIGVVMGHEGPYVQLRPYGGGREWDAEPEAVRQATAAERLREATAHARARSRGEVP